MRVMHLLAAVAVAALLSAGTASIAAPSGQPHVVGAILSMSGPYAPLGEPEKLSLQAAEKSINDGGGILGRPLQIKFLDDEGKADVAQQLATQLIGEKVTAIIGGSLTPTSGAIARVANASKVLQIYMTPTQSIWNTPNGVAKYTFEITPRNELEAEFLTNYMKTKMGTKKVAILADDQPYGTTGLTIGAAELARQGVDVVDKETFAPSATDVTGQLVKVKSSGADTILIWTASPVAAIVVRQAKQQGLPVKLIGTTGIVSDNFLRVAGKDSEGVLADMDFNKTHPDAAQARFMQTYRAMHKASPNNFAAFAWDAAQILKLAIVSAGGKTDGDSLATALENMKPFSGATGGFKFTAADHNGKTKNDIHLAIARGQVWFTE